MRGIGPKITSFFLRDVVAAFEMDESTLEPARYLQPIDRWTRRGAEALAVLLGRRTPKSDGDCAGVIVESSQTIGISPSLVNTGLWIFGARFAQTEDTFRKALSNDDALREFLEQQRESLQKRVRFFNGVLR